MLNNLTNFFNLVKTRFVKTTAEPDDVLILGVPDKRYGGGYKPAMIKVKDFGGGGGPVCDITMEPQTVTFGPEVYFVHPPGSSISVRDVINPGFVEITRDNNQGIFNVATEGGYVFGVSPANTGWNVGGWVDLTDIATRTYSDWRTAIGGNPPSMVGQDLVMVDYTTGKYYTIRFDYWQVGGGGGFSYYRREIFVSEKCEITFSDGTKQNTAAGVVEAGSGINVGKITNIDGTITYTVSSVSTGSIVNYSNVVFVDRVNGNDFTGLINRFDKPFLSVSQAINAASSGGSPSATNRALVYVRRGTYSNASINPQDYIDIYCEPGVVFDGYSSYTHYGSALVSTKFLGYARFNTTAIALYMLYGCADFTFEFDEIIATGGAIFLDPNPGFGALTGTISGNYVYAGTNGTAWGVRISQTTNVVMNISRAIESPHQTILVRYYYGNMIINCPKIRLTAGNIYGGNYKHAVIAYDPCDGNIEINGDIEVTDPVYYGGISAALTFWSAPILRLRYTGNIIGNVTVGMRGQTSQPNAKIVAKGNITSDILPIVVTGNGKYKVSDGVAYCKNVTGFLTNPIAYIAGNPTLQINNMELCNELDNTSTINLDTTTAKLILNNCVAGNVGAYTAGDLVYSAFALNTCYLNNVRSRKPLNVNVTDVYSPTGLIVDPNTQTPNIL